MTVRVNENISNVANLRYQGATGAVINGAASVLMPAVTAEGLALQLLEYNAFARGMAEAKEIIKEELQRLIAPADEGERKPAEKQEPVY